MAVPSSSPAQDYSHEIRDIWKSIEASTDLGRKALDEIKTHQIECKNNYEWIQFYLKLIMGLLGFAVLLEVLGGPGALRFILHRMFGE